MARLGWLGLAITVFLTSILGGFLLKRAQPTEASERESAARALVEGRAALARGDAAETVLLVRAIPEVNREGAAARLLAGRALHRLHRWQAAEGAWKRALALDPQTTDALWLLLDVYFVEQRWTDARGLALDVARHHADAQVRNHLLLELVRQEFERLAPGETIRLVEPVLVEEPQNQHARQILGFCYVQVGRVTDGLALLEPAVTAAPETPEGWQMLAWSLYETGRLARLEQLWPRVSGAAREQPLLLRYHGQAETAAGRKDSAERLYRKVLECDPDERKVHALLAQLLRARGAEAESRVHQERAQQLDAAREALAQVYTAVRKQEGAMTADQCRQFSRLCQQLGRPNESALWAKEAGLVANGPS